MSAHHRSADVLISGSGPVGSVLAGLLATSAVRCVLLDSSPASVAAADDPRTLALTPGSLRLLDHLGVLRRLPLQSVGEFRRMQVWDEAGSGRIGFDAADICQPFLGQIVEQAALESALSDLTKRHPLIRMEPAGGEIAIRWAEDHIGVALPDGRELRGSLLVCAEGANSAMRSRAGIDYRAQDYRQTALATVVGTEFDHGCTARQRFLRDGPLAFLPLADQKRCGIVWTTTDEEARRLLAMDAATFHAALADAFEGALGRITGSGPRRIFPLRRAHAERYCRRRFALAGDAAHCVHPLAGQGMNLGLQDAAALAQIVVHALEQGRDPGRLWTLRRYERWRRAENALMIAALDALQRLFSVRSGSIVRLRNAGLAAVDASPTFKSLIMRRAMGIDGDLPVLARAGAF